MSMADAVVLRSNRNAVYFTGIALRSKSRVAALWYNIAQKRF